MGGRGGKSVKAKAAGSGGGGSADTGENTQGRDSTSGLTPEVAKTQVNDVAQKEKQFYDDYRGLNEDLIDGLPNRFTDTFRNASKRVDRLLENRESLDKLINNTTKNQAEKDFIRNDFEGKVSSVLNQRVKAKFDNDSNINRYDSGKVNVRVGKGSFDVKDKLKDSGYKFNQGANGANWSKEYSNFDSFVKDVKDLKLI
jgi:hypothetical protein